MTKYPPDPENTHSEPGEKQVVAHSWRESDTFIPRAVVRPLQRLMSLEISTAIAALSAAVTALTLANTPLQPAYESFWRTPVRFEVAGRALIDVSLQALVKQRSDGPLLHGRGAGDQAGLCLRGAARRLAGPNGRV